MREKDIVKLTGEYFVADGTLSIAAFVFGVIMFCAALVICWWVLVIIGIIWLICRLCRKKRAKVKQTERPRVATPGSARIHPTTEKARRAGRTC